MPAPASPRRWLVPGLLLLLSAAAVWGAFHLDRPVRDAIVAAQGKGWKKTGEYQFHGAIRKWGDWPWLMAAGAAGFLVSWKLRKREWMRIVAAAMIASTLSGIVANASRLTTGRTRPRESPKIEQGFYGPWHDGKLTIGNSKFNSFPSGHTATAFGFAGPILYARPWLGLGALFVAGIIAWSSIMIGAHHPSDVVLAVILSLAVAWYVWRWMDRNGDALGRRIRAQWQAWRKRRT
jgi:membrane-associated phospholipid phosphatase